MLTANDFNLKTIQPLIDYDISGVLNGNVAIQEIYQSALINSDVKIDRFMFEKQLVGDISAKRLGITPSENYKSTPELIRENQEVVAVVEPMIPPTKIHPNLLTEVQAFPVKVVSGFCKRRIL
jgi:hypothetical protein